jgi:hypothetical protein
VGAFQQLDQLPHPFRGFPGLTTLLLAPGAGKTKTGRLWVYARDERPFSGERPPAALFFYSPDRKGEHPRTHLENFQGARAATRSCLAVVGPLGAGPMGGGYALGDDVASPRATTPNDP